MKLAFIFISTLVLFLAIDAVWITLFGSKWYTQYLSHLTSGKVAITPALLFYAIYIFGMLYFVIMPAIGGNTPLTEVALRGAILWFFAYSTYDLTNHVFMKHWPWFITITDILWGAFVTGTVATLIVKFFR